MIVGQFRLVIDPVKMPVDALYVTLHEVDKYELLEHEMPPPPPCAATRATKRRSTTNIFLFEFFV